MARSDNSEGEHEEQDNNSDDIDLITDGADPPSGTFRSCLSPPVVSNHSIGCGRSHSRHRRSRHRHTRNRLRFKRKESNLISAVCSMIVLVLLCTALAEPQWFYLSGGDCRDNLNNAVHYLGISQFFFMGHFVSDASGKTMTYHYGTLPEDVLINCVTAQVVSIMKSIISLTLFGIVLSLIAFLLDLSGPTHKVLKMIRRHGLLNILTVIFCVVINGFCYWATEILATYQLETKPRSRRGSQIVVEFSVSFFLITAAGAMSVIAAACNLLRRHVSTTSTSSSSSSRETDTDGDRAHLMEHYEGMDFGPDCLPQSLTCFPPPPPPYTP